MDEINILELPDYKWEVEIFPEVVISAEEKPTIWKRFWFRLFFGWKWEAKE